MRRNILRKFLIHSLALTFILSFINCATIFSDNIYTYNITSDPSNADVIAKDYSLIVGKCKTPCKIDINMRRETILKFEAKGYNEKFVTIEKGINGWVWGNLLFGGIIGLAIDYSNGSMYKPLNDKTDINIILEPSSPAVEEKKKGKK